MTCVIYRLVGKFVKLKFDTILVKKDPKLTDFDNDLHKNMPFQKSNLFRLQIMEWLINTDTHAHESHAVQGIAHIHPKKS